MPIKELRPVRPDADDFKELEEAILKIIREEIYLPLMKELDQPQKRLDNSASDVIDAIRSGAIFFNRTTFVGKFTAAVSRELKSLGAQWDKRRAGFEIPFSNLPNEIKNAVNKADVQFSKSLTTIDQKLSKVLPAKIADKIKIEKIFDRTLFKVQKSFDKSVASLEVQASFTPESRKAFAASYTDNTKLYIQKFTEEQTAKLRADIQARTFGGNRYESIISTIQKSYQVSANKAKFLARQETNLVTAKYKEVRYKDAGIAQYKWRCSAGSANHPVRPMHKALDGKTFSFDNPPIVNEKGDRKNPGEDFGCRCVAVPIVKF